MNSIDYTSRLQSYRVTEVFASASQLPSRDQNGRRSPPFHSRKGQGSKFCATGFPPRLPGARGVDFFRPRRASPRAVAPVPSASARQRLAQRPAAAPGDRVEALPQLVPSAFAPSASERPCRCGWPDRWPRCPAPRAACASPSAQLPRLVIGSKRAKCAFVVARW